MMQFWLMSRNCKRDSWLTDGSRQIMKFSERLKCSKVFGKSQMQDIELRLSESFLRYLRESSSITWELREFPDRSSSI